MTHIALIIPTIDQIGGAERQALLLARALSARGWRVTLIALSGTGEAAANELAAAGVAYLSLEMRKAWIDPRGWLRYLAWARDHRPEILHTHLPHATWFARWMRLASPVRALIDTIHTTKAGTLAKRLGYRLSNPLTNQITCVSESVAESAATAGIASPSNLTILPNGVELPDLPPSKLQAKNHPSGLSSSLATRDARFHFLWIAIGRLVPLKDYPTLLRAFAMLPGHPRLLIVGSGPEADTLLKLTHQLRIEDRVRLAGFQPDVQPLLAAADAFVLSSLWEGLPMGILEASASALPVVATDGPGTREAILDGHTGLLVPIANPAALSHAMSQLMTMTPRQRLEMGHHGRRFVSQRYALPVILDRWEQLYRNLLDRHPKPSRLGSQTEIQIEAQIQA